MFEKAFKLFDSVSNNFGEAWDLFQKGAKFYKDLTGRKGRKVYAKAAV